MGIHKVRINSDNGNLAEIEICEDEYGNYYRIHSSNIKGYFVEKEQTERQGFIDVLEIDIDNLLSPKDKQRIISNGIALNDIELLNTKFGEYSSRWEMYDGDQYSCSEIAQQELELVKEVAQRHNFPLTYNPSDYEPQGYDEWWEEEVFSEDDFENNDVTSENYGKADAVASDLKDELLSFLKEMV